VKSAWNLACLIPILRETETMSRRVGLWLIGAFGGVGTTITLGLSCLSRKITTDAGLTTQLPLFDGLNLPQPDQFIIGGHDIRKTSFVESAIEFRTNSGVFQPEWIEACRSDLEAASARVRPGTKLGSGATISKMGTWGDESPAHTAGEAVDRIARDLNQFVADEKIDHLIVLNVSSTEPVFHTRDIHHSWAALEAALPTGGPELLPSSTLYALAAIRGGHSYVNFTPSLGAGIPALLELADKTGSLVAGKDGKTGETMMKTVLAPMFAHRNLKVLSWVGHNIFGNRDGVVLDDPVNKASKVNTKDWVTTQILGYKPNTLVTIEYIPDMGDWKTAWDHIHFQGFMGTPMTLQFTWQGCDSLLAAPLAIDLARLTDLAKQHGAKGLQNHLAVFFKSPEGVEDNHFFRQWAMLEAYIAGLKK